MRPERWNQISDLFAATVARHPSDRATYLDRACALDSALRKVVEELLAGNEHADRERFLEEPTPWNEGARNLDTMHGRRIGPYEIDRFLGGGGMGDVYLAVRVEPFRRRVAIKLIKPGMNTEEILGRFKSEMQIHAALSEHPNIAGLLDAGSTEDGQQFFVMEYVDGQRIDEYCDTRKLSIRDRVILFRAVLSGVWYAHQNAIIHLDLKPGNILVTRDGVPKLVDFGIAQLLNPDLASQSIPLAGSGALTWGYASPEQVRGDPVITTASDVYSLGVILYELLTGHPPYDLESRSEREIREIVCEQNPERPSIAVGNDVVIRQNGAARTLTPQNIATLRDCERSRLRDILAGQLGIIPLVALRKEAQRRYPSVGEFSEDLRHWLRNEAIEYPHRPTSGERIGRWCRRNPLAVALASTAGLLVALVDIGASLSRLDERIDHVNRTNVFAAQSVASTVRERLQHLSSAVARASRDSELRSLLQEYDKPGREEFVRKDLQVLVKRFQEEDYDADSGFMWSAQRPFVTWFVLDMEGNVLAHSEDPPAPANLRWRSYFLRALDIGKSSQDPQAQVGLVYQAEITARRLYKFPIFTPIREKETGRVLGVLVASVPTESTVGTLLPERAPLQAVIVGRADPTQPTPLPSEFLVVAHPLFDLGDDAVPIKHEMLRAVLEHRMPAEGAVDDDYRDPVSELLYKESDDADQDFRGRLMAAFAHVEHTEFAVIVQQRYDKAVAPEKDLTRVLILWGGFAVSMVVGGAVLWYSVRHGMTRRWNALHLS